MGRKNKIKKQDESTFQEEEQTVKRARCWIIRWLRSLFSPEKSAVNQSKTPMNQSGTTLAEYLKQLSIVILGILIAFWLNNMGNSIQEKTVRREVLQTMLNEVNDNSRSTQNALQSLKNLHHVYSKVASEETGGDTLKVSYSGLITTNVGYETASFKGILKDVDYKLTSGIVSYYNTLMALKEAEKEMVTELMEVIKNKTQQKSDLDYLLLLINNLTKRLEGFTKEQTTLIQSLQEYLESE